MVLRSDNDDICARQKDQSLYSVYTLCPKIFSAHITHSLSDQLKDFSLNCMQKEVPLSEW